MINTKLQPFVIKPGKITSVKEADQLREDFKKVTKKLDAKEYQILPSAYTYTARPYTFPIRKRHVTTFIRGEDNGEGEPDVTQIPAYLTDNPDLLMELYGGIVIKGKVYSKDHSAVVKTKDTERYMLKDDVYNVLTGGYCEKQGNLIELPQYEGYAFKEDVIKSYDTQRLELKKKLYKWKGKNGDVRYYKYQQLSPDSPKKRIYFEESVFPDAEDIKETRVGIELEYSRAVEATRNALVNENFRSKWDSIRDGSIPSKGTEFVSVPFKKQEFGEIADFMRFCEKHSARISKKCGFHVHIGSPNLDFVSLTSVVLLCENIQEDLFKLVPEHRQNSEFCRQLDKSFRGFKKVKSNSDEEEVANIFYEDAGTTYDRRHKQSKYSCNSKRHYWVSIDRFFRFREEPHKRTVEFRMHHATHDPDEFMQFVYLCYYIVQFCIENNISTARNAELRDVVNWIPNPADQQKVENLLTNKKVLEYARF